MALVFYHRGHKLRPELQEFRLGIQKAQEAIDNSVGCKSTQTLFPNMTEFRPPIKIPLGSIQTVGCRRSDWSLEKVFSYKTISSTSTSVPSVSNIKSKTGNTFSVLF